MDHDADYAAYSGKLKGKNGQSLKNKRGFNNTTGNKAREHSRPTNNQLEYKAIVCWEHYPYEVVDRNTLPLETPSYPAVNKCFLQILNILKEAEDRRGSKRNLLSMLAQNTRRTKVVDLATTSHRIPEELRKQHLTDGKGGQYTTNLDRNRYGTDRNYLFTVTRYCLEQLGLCPCLVEIVIVDQKTPEDSKRIQADPSCCTCQQQVNIAGNLKDIGGLGTGAPSSPRQPGITLDPTMYKGLIGGGGGSGGGGSQGLFSGQDMMGVGVSGVHPGKSNSIGLHGEQTPLCDAGQTLLPMAIPMQQPFCQPMDGLQLGSSGGVGGAGGGGGMVIGGGDTSRGVQGGGGSRKGERKSVGSLYAGAEHDDSLQNALQGVIHETAKPDNEVLGLPTTGKVRTMPAGICSIQSSENMFNSQMQSHVDNAGIEHRSIPILQQEVSGAGKTSPLSPSREKLEAAGAGVAGGEGCGGENTVRRPRSVARQQSQAQIIPHYVRELQNKVRCIDQDGIAMRRRLERMEETLRGRDDVIEELRVLLTFFQQVFLQGGGEVANAAKAGGGRGRAMVRTWLGRRVVYLQTGWRWRRVGGRGAGGR